MLFSRLILSKKSNRDARMSWKEEVISDNEALSFKQVASVTELSENVMFSVCIQILM